MSASVTEVARSRTEASLRPCAAQRASSRCRRATAVCSCCHAIWPARVCNVASIRRIRELQRAFVVVLRRGRGRQRRGVVAGSDQRIARALPESRQHRRVRVGLERLEKMGRDDLGDPFLLTPRAFEVRRRRSGDATCDRVASSVPYATLLTRSWTKTYWPRSGDRGSDWMASRSLLTRLARAWFDGVRGTSRDRAQRRGGERLAEHRGILEQLSLGRPDAVEARCDQRVERLRNLERVERALDVERSVLRDEQAAVEQHAHRLDRVQRHARRALAGCARSGRPAARAPCPRAAATSPLAAADRGESDVNPRLPVPQPGAAIGHLRARQRDHEDRRVARPLEQILDEIEQAAVRPLQVLEDQDREVLGGEPLEEEPPRCVEIARIAWQRAPRGRRDERGAVPPSAAPLRSRTNSSTLRRNFSRAVSGGSFSMMPARMRTISLSAQYATPSP